MTATLDAAALRALQEPLRQRYHDNPSSAQVPVRVHGTFEEGDEGVLGCTVQGWSGPVRAGLHPSIGGDGNDASATDMLLEAVLASAGVSLRGVATAMELTLRSATLEASGDFDARGCLGTGDEAPVGCRNLRVVVRVDTDADDTALARLGELAERYCVVGQSLREPPTITIQRAHQPG